MGYLIRLIVFFALEAVKGEYHKVDMGRRERKAKSVTHAVVDLYWRGEFEPPFECGRELSHYRIGEACYLVKRKDAVCTLSDEAVDSDCSLLKRKPISPTDWAGD